METKRECVCLAYYVDDLFIGWYSDSFGSVGRYPKIYANTEAQISTIKTNFNHKMTRINETSFSKEIQKIPNDGQAHLEALRLLVFSYVDEKVLKGRKVELKMVACPYYDGPNPNFDREVWKKQMDDLHELAKEAGVYAEPAGTMKSMMLHKAFDLTHPEPKYEGWIYADSALVAPWALVEPTEFIKVIKFNVEPKPVKSVFNEEETGDVEMLPPTEV